MKITDNRAAGKRTKLADIPLGVVFTANIAGCETYGIKINRGSIRTTEHGYKVFNLVSSEVIELEGFMLCKVVDSELIITESKTDMFE